MNTEELMQYQQWAKAELMHCSEFWLKHGIDREHGGVYTCLDRAGKIYSTDKSVWMQGRCAWTYAYLCHIYGVKQEWLEASRSCLDFMEKYCINRAAGNRMYFTVTADGKPLRQRRYCFSEGFYCIANAEYFGLTGEKACLERARAAYELIYELNNGLIKDPTGFGPKTDPATRSGRSLADPMIYLNITAVLQRVDHDSTYQGIYRRRAAECTDSIVKYHYKPELKCTLETVGLNGEFMRDVTVGRIVNPGHDIECSWFMLEEANRRHDMELHNIAANIFNNAIEAGWDKEYDGLLYFIDCLGCPPEAYEHDMKLWWPHNEIMIASMMLYRDTEDEKYLDWFKRTVKYCRDHFSDPTYGEWYGYLRRDGKPTEPPCKGSTFKGPFHVMRSLIMTDKIIDQILAKK